MKKPKDLVVLPKDGLITFGRLQEYLDVGTYVLEKGLKKQGIVVVSLSGSKRRHSLIDLSQIDFKNLK